MRTTPIDTFAVEATERLEATYASWFQAHQAVPGVHVGSSPGLSWMLSPGVGWSNCGVRLRLDAARADRVLGAVFKRAFATGRGFGLWVSDLARPADLNHRLAGHGFRNRKRFPGMLADLTSSSPRVQMPRGIGVGLLDDHSVFERVAHPYFGRGTTPIRRFELLRLGYLHRAWPNRVFDLVATEGRRPVGVATLFLHGDSAVFFDVGVLESERRRGIGTALMIWGCAYARTRGASAALLLSSGMGYGMYLRAGFREACQIAYWYSAGRVV